MPTKADGPGGLHCSLHWNFHVNRTSTGLQYLVSTTSTSTPLQEQTLLVQYITRTLPKYRSIALAIIGLERTYSLPCTEYRRPLLLSSPPRAVTNTKHLEPIILLLCRNHSRLILSASGHQPLFSVLHLFCQALSRTSVKLATPGNRPLNFAVATCPRKIQTSSSLCLGGLSA